ncbi:LacI family DNA-binding transcriptional regulator [Comamonas sp. B21-038]|uniref:LacI family DNA-binding transcriptional regulator n=1 Tax=Comamonas sp. B21-038 TaxID=2918299 RepID=UPI002110EAA1|nr:LacI family DNA-binding transcriptional regulator [Comamonas sp. B21-038]
MQPTDRPCNIQDVARAAGVSAMTVSLAINHPERLNPETLQRVRDAITSMRCVPNAQPMAWA